MQKHMQRRKGFSSMDRVVKNLARQQWGRDGAVALDLMAYWDEIIGDKCQGQVVFRGIFFPPNKRNNGVLKLAVRASFAPYISFELKNILDRANQFYGYTALQKIQIEQYLK